MSRARAFDQLCRLLRGEPARRPDWPGVLALANQALVTPRLEDRLVGANAPPDVCAFVSEVARRNRERNARLLSQLSEAASALNAAGLTPLALKGAACLMRRGVETPRMLADLDLLVAPGQIDRAIAALAAAGFAVLGEDQRASRHEVVGLGRPRDAGQIDLHQRPPGPAGLIAEAAQDGAETWRLGPAELRLPSPWRHIYLQAAHDQFQDKAYWRGGLDLRHGWDIAELISEGGVDWASLAAAAPTTLMRRAVEAQLAACAWLTHAPMPPGGLGAAARLNAWRQRVQLVRPALKLPLAALTAAIEAPALARHRRIDGEIRARSGLPPVSRDWRRFLRDLDGGPAGRL